jgi:hypothetical protein
LKLTLLKKSRSNRFFFFPLSPRLVQTKNTAGFSQKSHLILIRKQRKNDSYCPPQSRAAQKLFSPGKHQVDTINPNKRKAALTDSSPRTPSQFSRLSPGINRNTIVRQTTARIRAVERRIKR